MGNKRDGDSCYQAALEDEPMFILLGRDPGAPVLVRSWAHKRQAEVWNGTRPAEDQAKVDEAFAQADKMTAWRDANDGVWRKP